MQKNYSLIGPRYTLRRTKNNKKEICNTVTNHDFDVMLNKRIKCDASQLGLGISLEQDHGELGERSRVGTLILLN